MVLFPRMFFCSLFHCLIAFAALSCAGAKTDSAGNVAGNFEKYNEKTAKETKERQPIKLITDFKNLPDFKNLADKMAPGHLFYLYHPSDEKLKGRFRADFQGLLRLPYNVRINVKGLTFSELRRKVLESYAKFFQRGVEGVDFKLLRKDYLVEVRGFVKDSGRYYVARNEGIDKVIDKAGGLRGDLQEDFYKASVNQNGESYSVSLNQYYQNSQASNAFVWTGGDKIFITELDESEMSNALPLVTVLGGVRNPGKLLYKPNAHIFYYLGKSGGVIDNLDYEESYVIRNTAQGAKKIQFVLTDMDSLPALAPNDIVMLQAQKPSESDKIMERLVQFATIITSIGVLLLL